MGRIRKHLVNLENLVEIMVQTKKVGGYLNSELVGGLIKKPKIALSLPAQFRYNPAVRFITIVGQQHFLLQNSRFRAESRQATRCFRQSEYR